MKSWNMLSHPTSRGVQCLANINDAIVINCKIKKLLTKADIKYHCS
jgi:hypothetical protein